MLLADDQDYYVNENDALVAAVAAAGWSGDTRRYSIAGGDDATLFTIDADTGQLRFLSPPDREAPRDSDGDNRYDVVIAATAGDVVETRALSVTVGDVDEAPVFEGWPVSGAVGVIRAENVSIVDTFVAQDPEGAMITYRLAGDDARFFEIDQATATLRFITPPDYEVPLDRAGDNNYRVSVIASDGVNESEVYLQVRVVDEHETVAITAFGGGDTGSATVDEGSTAVGRVTIDGAARSGLFYTLSGADAAKFTIDHNGLLALRATLDFEAPADADHDGIYQVAVTVADGDFRDTQAIAVTVANVVEPVTITSFGGAELVAISVAENQSAVATIAASSADARAVAYSIVGGADASLFRIDAATGALVFAGGGYSNPDFEAPRDADRNNVYDVVVSANDGGIADAQTLAVTVTDVTSALTISSNPTWLIQEGATSVGQVRATNAVGTAYFGIWGGADAAKFRIDNITGALSFIGAPDYEAPGDATRDNVYDIVIISADKETTVFQTVRVTVADVTSQIAITSDGGGDIASFARAENGTAVTTVALAGTNPTLPLLFEIAGGADASLFAIDPKTGALFFRAAPNYEAPSDADHDNIYVVTVRAHDGESYDQQEIRVTVTDVSETSVITGTIYSDLINDTAADPRLRSTSGIDVIHGVDGNDTLYGVGGDDQIFGDNGNDTLIGGGGSDVLVGGTGSDLFAYLTLSDSTTKAPDRINDFQRGLDHIHLANLDANILVSGDQNFTFIGTQAFSGMAGQLRFQIGSGETTIFADVNGDRIADFAITLTGNVSLAPTDFVL